MEKKYLSIGFIIVVIVIFIAIIVSNPSPLKEPNAISYLTKYYYVEKYEDLPNDLQNDCQEADDSGNPQTKRKCYVGEIKNPRVNEWEVECICISYEVLSEASK